MNANIRPATPIAKRLRQRPKLETAIIPEPTNQNRTQKSNLVSLAESLRSRLVPEVKRLPLQEMRNNMNMQVETKNTVLDFRMISEELTNESISVDHNPKLKLLFEDDIEIDEIQKPEEMEVFQSKEVGAEDSLSPSKRKLEKLQELHLDEPESQIDEPEPDTHTAKKRKVSSVESYEEISYSKPHKNLSGESLIVCLIYILIF